jgi:hypothetical protein
MVSDTQLMFKRLRNRYLTKPARDEGYLERVRLLPCVVCNAEPTEPHHVFQSSMSLKSSDHATIPVCRFHHDEFHRTSHLSETQARMMEHLIVTLARFAGEKK